MVENSSKRWTAEEDGRLRELIRSHAAAFDIAAELRRTVSAVKARVQLFRLTLGKQPNRSIRHGHEDKEMCGNGGVKRRWTQYEVGKLRELARNNSIEQIAEQLNRSPGSVKLKAFWLNVSLNSR